MNIKDIAKKAGVSIATVSRVINNKPGVKEEVREEIKRIIQENDYRPNLIARGLVSKKSNVIGVMIPQVNSFYTGRIEGTFEVVDRYGYGVMLATTACRFRGEVDNFFMLYEKQVEGVIYFASKITEEHKDALQKISAKIPVVMVDQEVEELEIPCVLQDNYSGATKIMSYLIEKGHRKIAFINGATYDKAVVSRYKAYCDMLEKNGIKFEQSYIGEGNYSINSGYRETEKIIKNSIERPTAIFAANDSMAIGAINYLSKIGLKIPQDIAVVGFDDIELAAYVNPSLTTIRQDHAGTGAEAAELLFDFIKNKKFRTKKVIMNQELIIREST